MNISQNNVFLRKAKKDDVLILFCWANDPVVRQSAFCMDDISWDSHKKWFYQALVSDAKQIFILQKGDLPIGQVRIELNINKGEWLIDYSIDAAWRRQGYGRKILYLLENKLPNGTFLLGQVKLENLPSQHVFEELGYVKKMKKASQFIEYRKNVKSNGGGHISLL